MESHIICSRGSELRTLRIGDNILHLIDSAGFLVRHEAQALIKQLLANAALASRADLAEDDVCIRPGILSVKQPAVGAELRELTTVHVRPCKRRESVTHWTP